MAAKRPSGFGKASKEKKRKQPSPEAPEADAELNIELPGAVDDEALAEVFGLFQKLREERDPKLARGLVHECDSLLRSRDEKGEALPPKFHIAYGGALLTLADPEINKEHKEFRDAGVSRINVGIASNDIEALALASIELVQYAHTQISKETGELSGPGKKLRDYAVNLLRKRQTRQHPELGCAAHRLLLLSSELRADEAALDVAREVLEEQAKSADPEVNVWGHKGLGQYYMTIVAPAIDALEGSDDEDGGSPAEPAKADSELLQNLQNAIRHLRLCVTDDDQESHVMLAEALLQWAGVLSDDKAEREAYDEALKHLKKARMLGNEGLGEIIESLENPED